MKSRVAAFVKTKTKSRIIFCRSRLAALFWKSRYAASYLGIFGLKSYFKNTNCRSAFRAAKKRRRRFGRFEKADRKSQNRSRRTNRSSKQKTQSSGSSAGSWKGEARGDRESKKAGRGGEEKSDNGGDSVRYFQSQKAASEGFPRFSFWKFCFWFFSLERRKQAGKEKSARRSAKKRQHRPPFRRPTGRKSARIFQPLFWNQRRQVQSWNFARKASIQLEGKTDFLTFWWFFLAFATTSSRFGWATE